MTTNELKALMDVAQLHLDEAWAKHQAALDSGKARRITLASNMVTTRAKHVASLRQRLANLESFEVSK